MKQNPSNHLRVLVVWEPILPSDWGSPGRLARSRISDPRVIQFWDKQHLVAQEISRQLSAAPQFDCCRHNGILWDVAALYPQQLQWKSAVPEFFEGPVVRASGDLAKKLSEGAVAAHF